MSAVFSLVGLTDDDQVAVEVATIGAEEMVGLPLFLGAGSSPFAAFCQIPGPGPGCAPTIFVAP